jgi:hypothetical protein
MQQAKTIRLLFDHDAGGDMFVQNIRLSSNYTALHLRKPP